jgi:hypothetical protein
VAVVVSTVGAVLALLVLVFPFAVPKGAEAEGTAAAAPYCAPGERPTFSFGFAALKTELGDLMGEPIECAHPEMAPPRGVSRDDESALFPTGNVLQETTTGVAVFFGAQNVPTFSAGWDRWAVADGGLVYWASQGSTPPSASRPGTVLFQAGWPAEPEERPTRGNTGWRTTAGRLITHGDTGRFERVDVTTPVGRSAAIEAQMQGNPEQGAFGLWSQRQYGTYRVGYTSGTVFLVADSTATGFTPADILLPRAVATAEFSPGDGWHTYRFEAGRTRFRLLVDGVLLIDVEDERFPGEVANGVWTDGAWAVVRDYRVVSTG